MWLSASLRKLDCGVVIACLLRLSLALVICIIQVTGIGQVSKVRKASVSETQRVRPAGRRRQAVPEGPARERILHAALDVFAERGFEGARTREIAERAGANLGLGSYYFGGKERLWRGSGAARVWGGARA